MAKHPSMQNRYDALVVQMKQDHCLRINKWRRSMSGCAWVVEYADGRVSRLIESPYPRGPMSAAIFLHEVGHHAIGLHVYKPRCLEELKAWEWSLSAMRQHGLNVTPAVRKRMHDSLHYAISKARRRGLKRLPEELVPYLQPWSAVAAPEVTTVRKAATPRVGREPDGGQSAKPRSWRDVFRQLKLFG